MHSQVKRKNDGSVMNRNKWKMGELQDYYKVLDNGV